jgi:hypothetical protein
VILVHEAHEAEARHARELPERRQHAARRAGCQRRHAVGDEPAEWRQRPIGCLQLLQGAYSFRDRYTVKYVLFGPQEMSLGNGDCVNFLTPIGNFGDVQIYLTANALERDDP